MVVRLLNRAKGSVVRVLNRARYRFSPTDLGADLLAWWDAEQPATITGGGAVSSWADVVAGYTATQAVGGSQPAYSATSFNGSRGGITFDGTADELTCLSAGLLAQLGGATSYEMWAAVDQTALVADTGIRTVISVGASNATTRRMGRSVVTGANRAFTYTADGVGSASAVNPTINFSGRHVVRSQLTATATMTEVDSVAMTPVAVVPATVATRVRLGAAANITATLFWRGVINTVLITRPLSTAQKNQLNAYLGIRTF